MNNLTVMKRLFFLIVLLFTSLNVLVTNAQRLYNVSWNTLSGVTESEDVIANTTSSAGYSVSGNQAASGETGYLEFSNFQIDKTKSIGIIVDGNTGAIDHCFSFVNNTVSIYNGSTLKIAAYIFSKGDKFKISFSGTTMQFYHNGILKTSYSFTNIILRIKIILSSQNSSFSGIKTSMGLPYTLSRPTSMNYVQTISPLQAVSSITSSGEQRKTGDYLEKIAYYDGLGRQIQTVGVAQSPMLRDEVQPMYYDNLGRKTREYLPYTVKTSSSGTYQSSAINTSTGDPVNQKTYMQSYYNANNDYQYAYIDNNYESSSLNRVVETVGIGADWKGKLADAKKKSFKYDYGTNNEGIMFVAVNDAVSPIKFYLENEYFVGTLIRTTITDENGNKSDEFKDKAGRLILKRSYIGSKTFSTYYVYDNLGSLRLIIQPKGVATLETSFTTLNYNQQYYIPDNIINTNCFLYEYDARDRMIAKLVPGQTVKLSGESKGAVFMVYNKKDQLILSQDGNLANQNKWKFTKYDVYGRPIMTGIYSPGVAISQVTMQSNVDNSTLGQYENRISTSYGYTTDQTYPNANLDVETVTCYDDYNYPGVSYSYATKIGFANIPTSRVDDKVTAQKVKALGTSTWLTTVNYYDEYGRTIQVKQNNYLSGSNVITNDYTFTNNISKVLTENTVTLSGENTKNYSLQKRYVYDNSDRVIDAFEKINSETEIQLSRVAYSEIGSVKEKNLHIISSKPALQSVDYSYNIRGWLTGINNTDLNDGEGDIFGMKLMYNDLGSYTSGSKQYNGNVSAWEWYGSWTNPTNASDAYTGKHAYTYQYDGLNRLLSAQYYRNIGRNTGFDFATTYDDNGNIKTMQQSATGYGQIDNLTYSYDNSEMDNRLRAVGDAATDVTNRGDFTEIATYEGTSSTEYSYDDNGNMLEDKNRNIKIQYNELNLPSLVTIGANTICYLYDANGS